MQKCFTLFVVATIALSVAACVQKNDGDRAAAEALPTAATLGEQAVLTPSDYLSEPRYADASRERGAAYARVCRACHSLQQGGPHMIGPALYGFFGSAAGSRDGYEYSPVLANADFVWTPRALDAWLAQPGRFLPGNRMSFAGLMQQSDRNDLIAYLLAATTTENSE